MSAPERPTPWAGTVPEADLQVYAEAGFGGRFEWGSRPAVVVVDVNRDFVGVEREPVSTAVRRAPMSCGEYAWVALPKLRGLLESARRAAIPVYYTTSRVSGGRGVAGVDAKSPRSSARSIAERRLGSRIVAEIAPEPEEVVIRKRCPSAFFRTTLSAQLRKQRIDTVVVSGCVTSGCVRATVVDAYSHGFRVVVPEECCFDRSVAAHKWSLFDIDQKYGDVSSLASVVEYFEGLL